MLENRTGIHEDIKYYFADKEPIWFLGESLSDRKDINDSLNRESVKIDTIDDLIANVELSLVEGEPRASVIFMKNIPLDLQNNLSVLVDALNAMPFVKVYEIDRDAICNFGQYVPDIHTLKTMAFEKTRSENIEVYSDPTDKQAEIMRSLNLDLAISRKKILQYEEDISKYDSEIFRLNEEIKTLNYNIDERYVSKIEKLEKLTETLEETIVSLQIDLQTETIKSNNYSEELQKRISDLSNQEYSIKAINKKSENKDNTIVGLRSEILNLKSDIDRLHIQQRKTLETTVDEETALLWEQQNNEARLKNAELSEQIEDLNIDLKTKQIENRELQNEISILRDGSNDIAVTGRTYNLDTLKLKTTKLVYIKVFEELPYIKQHINILFDLMFIHHQETKGKKGLMAIIKNDDGMDSTIFKGISVISNFHELRSGEHKYRLYPSSTMFSGANILEEDYDFIMVVDYIKSKDYYMSSTTKEVYMTSVSHSKKLNEFGLMGLPISNDSDSLVDIKYDPQIVNANFKRTRDTSIQHKVAQWYAKITPKL